MVDGTGTTTYIDDGNGDVTTQEFVAGSGTGLANQTVGYNYYSTGTLLGVVYPSYTGTSNPTVNYTYDATGQMASVTDWSNKEITFSHDQDNNETAQNNDVTGGSGTSQLQLTYDAADQNTGSSINFQGVGAPGEETSGEPGLTALRAASAKSAAEATPGACSWPWTISDNFNNAQAPRNPDGQLMGDYQTVTTSCGTPENLDEQNQSDDAAGRLVYQSGTPQGSAPNNFVYLGAGDPTELAGHTQTVDDDGEVTSGTAGGTVNSYSYDTLGDRTSFAVTGGSTTTYAYDQLGQMTSETGGPSANYYSYNGDGLQASEGPSAASISAQLTWSTDEGSVPLLLSDGTNDYVYGPSDTPVEQFNITTAPSSSNPTFINFVPSDSFIVDTGSDGNLYNFYEYSAYGSPQAGWSGPSPNSFGYAGQYLDPSGLYDLRARYLDPATAVFTTLDPDLSQTDQPYEYAGDDPVNRTDPSGESALGCVAGAGLGGVLAGPVGAGVGGWLGGCGSSPWTNPFDYIQSVQWTVAEENPPQPCPTGLRLLITPTSWGRFSYPGIEPLAWHEVVNLAGTQADTPTMHDQFDCHWYFVRLAAPRKPTWDIETWRPDLGLVGFEQNSCN